MDPGSSSSSNITSSARQLNDSLYELHRPPGRPTLQVLFFHGFQLGDYEGAHLSAWTSGDGSCIWPQEWLVEEFPKAHILTLSYHASLMKMRECQNIDLFVIGENIMSDLLQADIGQEVGCPVVLVGHSFGGLVMKEVCLHAQKKASFGSSEHEIFLRSMKGLFFYATPHHGIALKVAERFVNRGPLLEYVKTLSTGAARLNEDFEKLVNMSKWRTAAVGESLPLKWGFLETSLVVEEASSRYGDPFRVVMDADHISISRPEAKTSTSFNTLTSFLGRFSNFPRIPGNFQYLPKLLAGADPVIEEIKVKLGNTTCLGLVGMGGIGKTTLAKALFNTLEQCYEYTCFLMDVKNRKEEVVDLVLKNIHLEGKSNAHEEGGLGRLSGRLLLLALDDVASEHDLEIISLLRDHFLIHPDSRVLVTSRDSALLYRCLDAVHGAVHEVGFLDPQVSKELFLTYALPRGYPPSLEAIVATILQKCRGLPLTLEVIGKYLYGKPESIWAQAVVALDKAEAVAGLDQKIWAKLKLSYDGLDKEGQAMFLDAATVFIGVNLELAKAAWSITTSGVEEMRWQHLVDLSLVWEVPHEDDMALTNFRVGMHEQLLSLGRKLARNPGEHGRRIWELTGGTLPSVLREIEDINNIQDIVGLRLFNDGYMASDDCIKEGSTLTPVSHSRTRTTLENMFSGLHGILASCKGETHTGKNLTKVFHQGIRCDGCQERPIEGPRFKSTIDISYNLCLDCFQHSGSNASKYSRVDQPAYLHGSFQQAGLLNIPGSMLHKMGQLRYLYLWYVNIDQTDGRPLPLPSRLVYLGLCHMSFRELPFNPSHHKHLAILILYQCDELRTLPKNFGQLSSLQVLTIAGQKLGSLPDSIGSLLRLKILRIFNCKILQLPETLGNLVALEHLLLWFCESLSELPKSLGCLSRLKCLDIAGCYHLHELPETFLQLQGLERILLRKTSLHGVPDLENLRWLKKLHVSWADTAPFPKLPACLETVISTKNYCYDLKFKVSDGQVVPVADFE